MSALDSLFKCNLCTSPSFSTGTYKDWVQHLASPGHQKQGRKKLDVRERWEEEDSAYIITGQVFQDSGELPFSRFDLGEWLTSFGLLGELFVDRKYGFVVFTMKDSPSKKGADMNLGLVQKFKGHEILIRPKSDYKRNEWVIYFADVDSRIRAESEGRRKEEERLKKVGMPGTGNKVNMKSQSRDNIGGANAKVTKTEKTAVQNSTVKSSSTSGMQQMAQKPKPLMGERSSSNSTFGRRGSGSNFQNSSSTRTNKYQDAGNRSNSSGAFKGSHFERPGPSSKAPDRSTSNQGFAPSNFRKGPTNADNSRHEMKYKTTTKGASATRHAQNKVDVDSNVGNRWAPIDQYLQNNPSLPDFSSYHQSRKNDSDNAKGKNFFPSHQHHQQKGTQKTEVKTAFPPTTPELLTVTVSSTSAAQGSPSSSEANAESTFDFRGGFSSSFNAGRVVTVTSGPSSSPMPNHPETQHGPQSKSQPYTQEGSNKPVPPFRQQYPILPMARPILPQPLLAPNAVQHQRQRQPYRQGHPNKNLEQGRPRTFPSPNFIQAVPIPYHIRKSVVNPAVPVSSSTGNPSPYVIVKPTIPYFSNLFDSLICPGKGGVPKKLKEDFNSHDLFGQLQEFFNAQSLTDEEARLRWQLIVDLLFLLKLEHPKCQLYPFGSILTGLGDFDSDIDIFVDLDGNSETLASREEDTRSKTVILDIVKKILRKSQCPHTYTRFLSCLIPVKSARVPILKLTHAFSKINCDLSFENRLSVQNSKLLLFYLNWDDRILQFMKLIRFWAKFHKISGSNYIKNYAIALLVLVFLCEKSILPSVHLLQTLEAEERKKKRYSQNPDEICGWDASFTDKIGLIRKHFNAKPFHGCSFGSSEKKEGSHKVLICMAKEFFQRWANVDFNSVVVCPLLGEVLPRKKFMPGEEENLPPSLERYINWAKQQPLNRRLNLRTNLCIQDPFLLSFNVGSVTTDGTLFKFQIACAKTHQLLEKSQDLKSLLDVFCPLPSHVGDKKFLRVYRTEQRKEELLVEIKSALNLKNESVTEEQSGKSEVTKKKSKSVYVNLPTHLLHLEPYMDEQALKTLDRKGRWESFLEFSLTSVFESIFVTEITRCRMQACQKMNMLQTLTQLWIDFTSDFFEEFFAEGLKLKVAEDMKKSVFGCESDDPAIKEDVRKPRWNLKTLTKKEEAYFGISNKNSVEVDMMLRKIISFQDKLNGKNQFRRIVMDVDYPFWEKRPGIMEEVRKKMEVDQIVIPMLPKKEEKRDRKRGKKGSAQSSKGGGKEKEKQNQLVCFNPITLEGMVSDKIKESMKKDEETEEEKEKGTKFTSFKIDMLMKTDVKWGHEKPRLFIIFEENGKATRSEMMRALQSISYILDYAYPDYLNWRLAKYLDMEVSGCSSNMLEQIGKMDYLEEVILKTEEKSAPDMKKKRTKSEEDLLIPSSSSETDAAEEDDDEDEKSEEDEKEEKQEEKQEDDNDNVSKTEQEVENV